MYLSKIYRGLSINKQVPLKINNAAIGKGFINITT